MVRKSTSCPSVLSNSYSAKKEDRLLCMIVIEGMPTRYNPFPLVRWPRAPSVLDYEPHSYLFSRGPMLKVCSPSIWPIHRSTTSRNCEGHHTSGSEHVDSYPFTSRPPFKVNGEDVANNNKTIDQVNRTATKILRANENNHNSRTIKLQTGKCQRTWYSHAVKVYCTICFN